MLYIEIELVVIGFTDSRSFLPRFLCFLDFTFVCQNMVEAGQEVIEFKWGNMRSVGGRKKDVRFYDSFSYDGVDYSLFDSVFLYKEGEPVHYIGKIIKIWETADKNKRVKVLWYFRPSEIGNFLEGSEALENELFLASGEGEGLANVSPLVIGFFLNVRLWLYFTFLMLVNSCVKCEFILCYLFDRSTGRVTW